jgi:hypothetical protein
MPMLVTQIDMVGIWRACCASVAPSFDTSALLVTTANQMDLHYELAFTNYG